MTISRIAADIGGTFTDIAAIANDGRLLTYKLPSTPENYADAVVRGVEQLIENAGVKVQDINEVLHGCTVATNAILQMEGAKTGLLTTRGFRDVLELRRIRVPRLYDPLYEKPVPLVPRHLRLEIDERLDSRGGVLRAVNPDEVIAAAHKFAEFQVEAIAVCFLHSYANPEHERQVGQIIRSILPNVYLSLSVDILPQKREYERTSTTVINSYVGPPVSSYLTSMIAKLKSSHIDARLMVMQSSGGILEAESVIRRPANIVESGPAAGVIAAQYLSRSARLGNLITLDMGGTTAKASIIENGMPIEAAEYEVGGGMSTSSPLVAGSGYALKLPAIDISEVGSGGGSIAWLDRASALKVGPRSAGAVPGPACYGAGNSEPTVTDANVILGFLNGSSLAGGTVAIDADLAARAISDRIAGPMKRSLLESAFGIHTVANANMMRAVKAVTTYRGRDPRSFSLIAFGGNGGIHGIALAQAMQIPRVIIPRAAGVLSAVGLLFADLEASETAPFSAAVDTLDTFDAESVFAKLTNTAKQTVGIHHTDVSIRRLVDARFVGQAFELTVPVPDGPISGSTMAEIRRLFRAEHTARYGHDFAGKFAVEIVNLRVVVSVGSPSRTGAGIAKNGSRSTTDRPVYFGPKYGTISTAVVSRGEVGQYNQEGPLIIEEYEGTAVIPPGWRYRRDDADNLVIERVGA